MSTSFSNILAGSVCQVDGVLVGETWLVLDTHKILCTLAVFSSSKLLALIAHNLYTFANRSLQLYIEVENGVLSRNVYRVHSAVSGMEAKPAMQSRHKRLQCSTRYNCCNAPSAGCVGERGVHVTVISHCC